MIKSMSMKKYEKTIVEKYPEIQSKKIRKAFRDGVDAAKSNNYIKLDDGLNKYKNSSEYISPLKAVIEDDALTDAFISGWAAYKINIKR